MTVDTQSKEGQAIRQLIPLSTISTDQFEAICNKITIKTAEPNTFLFKKNDTEDNLVYLIKGSVRLQSDNLIVESISSDSESSKFALAHQIPRKIDAITLSKVSFIKLDPSTLEALESISPKQEENSYMPINEPEEADSDNDDWMTTLLKSPIFKALPPANLQQIIMSLTEVNFQKGELIIKQGDPGDFYYLIKKGHCLISRKPSANAKEIKLAQLRTQDTFGEDALLSEKPRNVSVTALTDTSLICLSKDKFISLIKEPSLKFINYTQVPDELAKGTALIDVRSADEYNKQHLAHSVNTPFFSLRMYIKSLNKAKPVIVICKNGKTSEAAAFLLLRNKFSATIVEGGIENIPEEDLETAATFGIDNITDKPTIGTVIKPEVLIEDTPQPSLEIEPSESTTDDTSLQEENKQLKLTVQSLKEEKETLEKKYRMLYKQTEKLKAALDTLKK